MAGRIEENRKLTEQLMRQEGTKRNRAGRHITYYCPAGALTIGYGHNLDARPIPDLEEGSKIDEPRARKILREDMRLAAEGLDASISWWRELGEVRSAVLLNMAFNMGVRGLLGFRNTLKAVREHRWKDARDGMLASKWAGQAGRRASELAAQMLTGKWQAPR